MDERVLSAVAVRSSALLQDRILFVVALCSIAFVRDCFLAVVCHRSTGRHQSCQRERAVELGLYWRRCCTSALLFDKRGGTPPRVCAAEVRDAWMCPGSRGVVAQGFGSADGARVVFPAHARSPAVTPADTRLSLSASLSESERSLDHEARRIGSAPAKKRVRRSAVPARSSGRSKLGSGATRTRQQKIRRLSPPSARLAFVNFPNLAQLCGTASQKLGRDIRSLSVMTLSIVIPL